MVAKPTKKSKKMEIEDLAIMVQGGFSEIGEQFKAIDKRFDEVDKRFEKIDERFEAMDKRFDRLENILFMSHERRIEKLKILC